MNKKFTFIDLFSGIGGFRVALESLGGKCIASSEIDNDAIHVYKKNWPNDTSKHNLGDITKIEKLPQHDLLVGGVPCQSWSIAGKNKGINDPRGKLWDETIRLLKSSNTKAFIFENVKGLADPRHKEALNYLLQSFEELGYDVSYKVLNSYDYGVPQNRDRIFLVGIHKNHLKERFNWPYPIDKHVPLHKHFKDLKPGKIQLNTTLQRNLFGERVNVGFNKLTPKDAKNPFFIFTDIRNGETSIHSWDLIKTTKRQKEICIIIMKNRRKPIYGNCDGNPMSAQDLKKLIPNLKIEELNNLIKLNILKKGKDSKYEFVNRRISGGINGIYRIYLPESTFFSTLTATGTKDMIATVSIKSKNYREGFISEILTPKNYRPLTSKEMAIIQGFPTNYYVHEQEFKNIKLFGNSVSIPVIKAIGQSLLESKCFSSQRNYNEVALAS